MQFGLMAQSEDSAAQAHRDLGYNNEESGVNPEKIEMKMSMWEKMGDGAAKEKIYESIQDLFDKSDYLQT